MTRVLFTGSREWDEVEPVRAAMAKLHPGTIVIEGEAPGLDVMAKAEAIARGLVVEGYDAEWTRYGLRAGPIRNRRMLVEGKPDFVVFFHHDLTKSAGTANCVRQALRAGIRVVDGLTGLLITEVPERRR